MSRNKALTRARSARAKGSYGGICHGNGGGRQYHAPSSPRRQPQGRLVLALTTSPLLAQHPCDRAPDHQMNRPGAAVEDEVDLTIGAPGGDVLAATPTARILGLRRVP